MGREHEKVTDSGVASVGVAPVQPDALAQLYTITDRDRVLRFLDEHGYLTPLLLEAYGQIRSYFPAGCLFLDIVTDPEAADSDRTAIDTDHLVLSVATQLDTDEAMDRLDQLDNTWWLDALPQAHEKLCINLEFQ